MSYFGNNTYLGGSGRPVTPMIADILAIHELYGVPTNINAGDTVYGYQSNAGSYLDAIFELFVTRPLSDTFGFTLYDSSGNDTLDFRTDTTDQRVDLRPEGISTVYGGLVYLVIARNTLIENFHRRVWNRPCHWQFRR